MTRWNAQDYEAGAAFVPALGEPLLQLLAARPGEEILDLGCGDGVLGRRIAESGARVLGFDQSPELLAAARRRGLAVAEGDGQALPFVAAFDAVFSNAALHWMPDQVAVARGVFRALRPGGRYVGECGSFLNIAAIRTAIRAVLRQHGLPADDRQTYLTSARFRAVHEEAGFCQLQLQVFSRPTPLAAGIRGWLHAFQGGFLARSGASAALQEAMIDEIEELLAPALRDESGLWTADYVRMRWAMAKPAPGDERAS